jgi:hypothetical protein
MYGVIFTLGSPTGEIELDSIRARDDKSPICQYFDDIRTVDPIDGLNLYEPETMPEPKRKINMKPVEGRSGQNYVLIVPTRAGAVKKGGGSIVDRSGYFNEADKIIGVGMCRLHSKDHEHGDIVFPERVDNSHLLRKMWGKYYYSGSPDQELLDELYLKCLGNGLTAVKFPLTISMLDIDEGNRHRNDRFLKKGYRARDMEMGWLFAHARNLDKPAAGALVISDRRGGIFDMYTIYHNLPDKTYEGISKLLEAAVQVFVE